MNDQRVSVKLTGVPETLLWPLYGRAAEARRADGLLRDSRAVWLMDSIEYPFEERFGRPSQVFALRARSFDKVIEEFIAPHPDALVVSLGEGLETQFWRVDNGSVHWLTVDLPETLEIRCKLLPDGPGRESLACSAFDPAWMDSVEKLLAEQPRHLCIVVQGLLMYFRRGEVDRLLRDCAARFPGATIVFDTMPGWLAKGAPGGTWLSASLMRGRDDDRDKRYRLPPMHWGTTLAEAQRLKGLHPAIKSVRDAVFPPGRGLTFGYLNPFLGGAPVIRGLRPRIFVVEIQGGRPELHA
jgi:O-methyltransferase involved in polyketide biosynthesis